MQKWEYLFIEASPYSFGEKLINLYANSEEMRDWKNKPLHEFVNFLGDQGLELVGDRTKNKLPVKLALVGSA